MPPKRKQVDHESVTLTRGKIRKGSAGKRLVDEAVSNNVLLFLEKLKDHEAKNYNQAAFQSKLEAAVLGALDPKLGPDAVIDLTKYDPGRPPIFANRAAGQLMSTVMSLVEGGDTLTELQKNFDQQKKKLEKEQQDKGKVEKTLAYLQELIPLNQAGKQDLVKELEALEQPVQDAAWLYAILWGSSLHWMDSRMRQLHAFTGHNNIRPQEPPSLRERIGMINTRMHGGDLRADALLCNIHFGDHRHGDGNYDIFCEEAFKKMYKLTSVEGLWLGECQRTLKLQQGHIPRS